MNERSNAIHDRSSRDQAVAPSAAQLLSELKAVHRQLETCLAGLETMTGDGAPGAESLGAMRLRIGKAILAKRQVVWRIYGEFNAGRFTGKPETLRELKRRDLEQFQLTSKTIQEWTPALVQDDWAGYRDASRRVREGLREIIAAEKNALYPLLGALR